MKISITILLLLAAVVLTKDPVQVTVYATAEEPELKEYVEIVAAVGETDASLPKALSNAAKKVLAVNERALAFCGDKDKKKCQESIDVSDPKIESKYQLFRRVETFLHFVVEHEITLKVYKTDQIGNLVDDLQRIGVKKFESFTWKALKEVDEEVSVVVSATERVEALCAAFNQKIDRVVSIEHFTPEQKEEEEEEEEEQQEEEEEEDQIYKLVFECVDKKGTAKA